MFDVPPEFQRILRPPAPQRAAPEPETVTALESFAAELLSELDDAAQLYQLNRARLAFADRYELLRRGTPIRYRNALASSFNRYYAELYNRHLALTKPDLAPPPERVVVEPPPKPKSQVNAIADVLAAARKSG